MNASKMAAATTLNDAERELYPCGMQKPVLKEIVTERDSQGPQKLYALFFF